MVANGLNSKATIYIGQNLRIPNQDEKVVLLAKAETPAADIVPARVTESKKKEIQEDFFAVYKIDGAGPYRIKAGDNIWSLCRDEFDLPFWLIRKFNTAHDFNNLKLDE
jgi:hypothetical protein